MCTQYLRTCYSILIVSFDPTGTPPGLNLAENGFYLNAFPVTFLSREKRVHNGLNRLIYRRYENFLSLQRRPVLQVSNQPHFPRYIYSRCERFRIVCRCISVNRYIYTNQSAFYHSRWPFYRHCYAVTLLVASESIQINHQKHRELHDRLFHSCVRWCRHR